MKSWLIKCMHYKIYTQSIEYQFKILMIFKLELSLGIFIGATRPL